MPMIVIIVVFMVSVRIGNSASNNTERVVKYSIVITIFSAILYLIFAFSFFTIAKIDKKSKLPKTGGVAIYKYEQKS